MFKYQKRLQYPVNIKSKDVRLAKILVDQYGGSQGELAAALRYLNQRYTMPDNHGKALLTDIGTEELAHVEIISTMVYQLLKDATIEEIKKAGLEGHYAEHNKALYPTDANGVPFTITYISTTGDPLADISEDMAAEQKARAVYENLIDLTDDPDVIGPLLWLRQREIVHYNRFKELFEYYQKKLDKKQDMVDNNPNLNNMNMDQNMNMNQNMDMNNFNIPFNNFMLDDITESITRD